MTALQTAYLSNEPTCKVIGPQIGPLFSNNGVAITLGLPHRLEIDEISCRLHDETGRLVSVQTGRPAHQKYRNYKFEFTNLDSTHQYSYEFYSQDQQIDLEAGLAYSDCCFDASAFADGDRFILLSCNNPYESGQEGDARFAMWDTVLSALQNDRRIKLLIQGGDQVYNDAIETECLERLQDDNLDEDWVIERIIRNYQHFYSWPSYRKALARVPSVAMLDDHDITDGWGGRPQGFMDDGRYRNDWSLYLKNTYDAFKAYQSAKNPSQRISDGVESTFLDFGNNRLYLLDLRREKNTRQVEAPLISALHKEGILASLDQLPPTTSSVYVLTPVVAVRIKPDIEKLAIEASTASYDARLNFDAKIRKAKKTRDAAIGGIAKAKANSILLLWHSLKAATEVGGNADLADDLSDSLSSEHNLPVLVALLTKLDDIQRKRGIKCCILSGDIHTGGVSEIICRIKNGITVVIPQVVSSPIASEPMVKALKDSTSTEGEFSIGVTASNSDSDSLQIVARNLFYRSDRNFCVVTPHQKVDFCFERLHDPISYFFP